MDKIKLDQAPKLKNNNQDLSGRNSFDALSEIQIPAPIKTLQKIIIISLTLIILILIHILIIKNLVPKLLQLIAMIVIHHLTVTIWN